MKPESEIYLCNVPDLNPDYAHTWRFDNLLEQQKYFKAQAYLTFDKYSYFRQDNTIKVNIHIDSIHPINYVMYKNKHNKWYYCFVMRKEYINELTTKLYIKTDVIQTYMFDFDLLPSFVDRCHVDRWDRNGNIIKHDEPEDLEFGEYEEFGPRQLIHQYDDNYLVFASNPLGVIDQRNIPGGGTGPSPQPPGPLPPGGATGDWDNGIISADCLRFVKGYEAYAPRKYLDKLAKPNVWTVGYGVTLDSEKDAYNYLVAREPASEEDCAKVSYYLKNERYGKAILASCKSYGVNQQREFDALVSFSFNLGTGVINGPQRDISVAVKEYKAGRYTEQQLIDNFNKYNKAGGKVEPGLTLRREAEANMFLGRPYDIRRIPIANSNGQTTGQYVTENNGNGWLPT